MSHNSDSVCENDTNLAPKKGRVPEIIQKLKKAKKNIFILENDDILDSKVKLDHSFSYSVFFKFTEHFICIFILCL